MKHPSNQPQTAFIVVGWNNKDLIDECFASMRAQTNQQFSIIFVDNGSTDNSLEYIIEHYPEVILVDAGSNQGFAIGNNLGIKRAFENEACRYVALINSDARIEKDWLATLVSFAESHPNGAGFQTPTYDYYDHSVLDSRGITINNRGQAVQLGHREPNTKLSNKKVFGVNAAAALYSRSFLETQTFGEDYFDSTLWMYLEDVDLSARAIVTGWDNWLVSASAAYHMGSASSGRNPGFSVYLIYRNNLPMLVKNLPYGCVLRILPRLIWADLHTLRDLWRGRSYIAIKSILRGRLKSIPMTLRFLKKHRQLRRISTIKTAALWQLIHA